MVLVGIRFNALYVTVKKITSEVHPQPDDHI